MNLIHGGIYKICRPVASQFIKNRSTRIFLIGMSTPITGGLRKMALKFKQAFTGMRFKNFSHFGWTSFYGLIHPISVQHILEHYKESRSCCPGCSRSRNI